MKFGIDLLVNNMPVVRKNIELNEGETIVRYGSWYWWRTPDGVLHESLLSDEDFGPVTDEELRAVLNGERRA